MGTEPRGDNLLAIQSDFVELSETCVETIVDEASASQRVATLKESEAVR